MLISGHLNANDNKRYLGYAKNAMNFCATGEQMTLLFCHYTSKWPLRFTHFSKLTGQHVSDYYHTVQKIGDNIIDLTTGLQVTSVKELIEIIKEENNFSKDIICYGIEGHYVPTELQPLQELVRSSKYHNSIVLMY